MNVSKVLSFTKVRNVKSPARGYPGDAGVDCFIPEDFKERTLCIGESIIIPLGLKVHIPHGTALLMSNKSGVCTSKGLIHGAGTIDHGYTGEISVHLMKVALGSDDFIPKDIHEDLVHHNAPKAEFLRHHVTKITPGERIAQVLLTSIYRSCEFPVVQLTNEQYDKIADEVNSPRGDKRFGSTGQY